MSHKRNPNFALETPSSWLISIKSNSDLTIDIAKNYIKLIFQISDSQIKVLNEKTFSFTLRYSIKETNLLAKLNQKFLNNINLVRFIEDITTEAYTNLLNYFDGELSINSANTKTTKTAKKRRKYESSSESEESDTESRSKVVKKSKN